ncbi:RNA polymerase sigma factor, sigma-24 family [Desulfonema limicola]|uniref:RNA polymerase sigma factor, sigma-24 family n=1 Tax=Desulfonema limicola TaxID=45656 RepID=A0A975BC73_9BACT|nr:RNA polymerase sigma factor [Desulfonema limicola]QTA82924.1 RNA polymerase sigma factor, sigma-24 family [Desulfonema limicola]
MPNINNNASDLDIIEQIVRGNINAFEIILKKYETHVLNILKKHLPYEQVEETAQEVFIRVYNSLPGFKQKSTFKHWISSIAVKTCYDFWRKQYKTKEVAVASLSEKQQNRMEMILSDQAGQYFKEEELKNETRELLDLALSKLSPENRMVIELTYLEGLSIKQTASLLGWSSANVKIRCFRSRKELNKIMKQLSPSACL